MFSHYGQAVTWEGAMYNDIDRHLRNSQGRGDVLTLQAGFFAIHEGRGDVIMLQTDIYAIPEGGVMF